ncbi:MAG: LacI family DNA-binding transcriptional regulator [Haliscomenobacter sp.]|uniref:LacI family DNA-binding transcriptional regulator n=1 Tax=Haliscomenobacter sp. TaxID=2717303 RepID=UPI0029AE96B4|nr:LacI family DNA-binding transcriptional regulator [Haliscomenobacter sp.]MDX2070981.1 LacI family DNA-binding transcriptional regulator [Haliscomenobacter sp.]
MDKRVTIKDIAKQAGVSVGTVDRVIHDRGRVSVEVKAKVLQVMQALNFEPNLIASTLAFNRVIRIGVLMPQFQSDPYWDLPLLGMRRAQQSVKHYGVSLLEQMFDLFSPQDFKSNALTLIDQKPDALVFPPIFLKESMELLDHCAEMELPTILVNTDVEHPQVMSYIGQDSYQSGVLAGKLLSTVMNGSGRVLLLNLDKETLNAKHLMDKELGLRHFLAQKNQDSLSVLRQDVEDFDDLKRLETLLNELLQQYADIKTVFVTNSRAYKLVEAIQNLSQAHLPLLGYDLLPNNLHFLQIGKIDFLINQNASYQGYLAIKNLTDYFIFKKQLPRVQHLPLDIVVAENAVYYLQREQGN